MNSQDDSGFDEIDLRPSKSADPRPHSTSRIRGLFNSAFRKSWSRARRRFTTSPDLVKNSISSPASCSPVEVSEEDFEFSRNSIQCCPFDISGYGSFILMNEFKVRKPKKMMIMVFMFERIVIFTKKQPNEEAFYYMGSVKMDQVGLLPLNKNKCILEFKDHVASAKFHREVIFSLEAASEYIQQQWRKAIEKCLWGQLLKAKREGGLKS